MWIGRQCAPGATGRSETDFCSESMTASGMRSVCGARRAGSRSTTPAFCGTANFTASGTMLSECTCLTLYYCLEIMQFKSMFPIYIAISSTYSLSWKKEKSFTILVGQVKSCSAIPSFFYSEWRLLSPCCRKHLVAPWCTSSYTRLNTRLLSFLLLISLYVLAWWLKMFNYLITKLD